MITIDVTPAEPRSVDRPKNWQEVAEYLGVSPRTIASTRRDLGLHNVPLDDDVLETMRRVVRWCDLRNNGGGKYFTRRNYLILKMHGGTVLDDKLRECGII